MGLDDETEPVAYHSSGFDTKSACTRLITPSFTRADPGVFPRFPETGQITSGQYFHVSVL